MLASLEQVLQRPDGFASSEALRPWLRRTHGVEVTDNTLDTLVRTRFKAKRTVPRPRHTQKPEATLACKATGQAQLQRAMPATNTRPGRVFSQDDSRVAS